MQNGNFNNSAYASKPVIGVKKTATKKKGFFSDSDEDFSPPVKKPVQ